MYDRCSIRVILCELFQSLPARSRCSVLLLTEYRLHIYNRWGQVVFESRDPGARWRGLVQGQDTDSLLFIWQAEFTLPGRERESGKGTLMFIR